MKDASPPKVSLYLDKDMAQSDVRLCAGGQAGIYSARCPQSGRSNQDSAALISISEECCVIAIADGSGGLPSGAAASRIALKKLGDTIRKAQPRNGDLRGAIMDGFDQANQAVRALGVGACTTLVVAEIQGNTLRPYHAGDSMVLVVGQRGKKKLQTINHSPVGYAMASGLMDEKKAMDHEQRHIVSNVVGSADMRIEVGPNITLAQKDTVVLASDGLFDNLHMDEIIDVIRKGTIPEVMGELTDTCRRRMTDPSSDKPSKPDDMTVIAYRPNNGKSIRNGNGKSNENGNGNGHGNENESSSR